MAGNVESGLFKGLLEELTSKETISAIIIWQILAGLLSSVLTPFNTALTAEVESLAPLVPLSPALLADGYVRGFFGKSRPYDVAAKSGVNKDDLDMLINLAGDAPAPGQLAEALRRGIIKYGSQPGNGITFVDGIAEGRLADKWTDMIARISQAYPSPVDIVDATVKGQIDYHTGHTLYQLMGGALTNHDDVSNLPNVETDTLMGVNTDLFGLLYNSAGSSPTPLELASLVFRGYMDKHGLGANVTSYDQGVKESHYKDKWGEMYFKLAQTLPTVQQIATLLKSGAMDKAQGRAELAKHGMGEEAIGYFLQDATATKTTTAKELAESTVLALYVDQIVSRESAITMLEALKYSKQEADFIMSVQDLKRQESALKSALSRVHSLYTGHKIDKTSAINALNSLQIPPKEVNGLIQTWDLERNANIKALSASEVVNAWNYGIVSQADAEKGLQEVGYQPHDAWVLLSIKNKAPLPGEPPKATITNVVI